MVTFNKLFQEWLTLFSRNPSRKNHSWNIFHPWEHYKYQIFNYKKGVDIFPDTDIGTLETDKKNMKNLKWKIITMENYAYHLDN